MWTPIETEQGLKWINMAKAEMMTRQGRYTVITGPDGFRVQATEEPAAIINRMNDQDETNRLLRIVAQELTRET